MFLQSLRCRRIFSFLLAVNHLSAPNITVGMKSWILPCLLTQLIAFAQCSTFCSSDWRLWAPDRSAFHFSSSYMTFDEALDFCKSRSGYMANITSEEEYFHLTSTLKREGRGSVWVSGETRPEHFSLIWRLLYAPNEPDHSGRCLYLSSSNDFKWRDTSCSRRKGVLCERHDCDVIDNDDVLNIFGIGVHIIDEGSTRATPWPPTSTLSTTTTSACTTLDGRYCLFPFVYDSVEHNECIVSNELDERGWCSLKTDEHNRHIEGTNTWAYCSDHCPQHQ